MTAIGSLFTSPSCRMKNRPSIEDSSSSNNDDNDGAFYKPADCEMEYAERHGLLPTTKDGTKHYTLRRKQFDIRLHRLLETPEKSKKPDWKRSYWLGMALFLALCAFWILDSLKDPVFGAITGDLERLQPIAKLISVAFTIAIVVLTEYVSSNAQTKHEHTTNQQENDMDAPWQTIRTETSQEAAIRNRRHERTSNRVSVGIFSTIGVPYCLFFGFMAYLLQFNQKTRIFPQENSDRSSQRLWTIIGYAWFAAIESYGSIAVATFWSYVNSTMKLQEAEAFYGIIIGFAQVGALTGSTMVTTHIWSSVTLSIVACLIMVLHIVVMQLYDRKFPPCAQQGDDEDGIQPGANEEGIGDTQDNSMWSGLYLILRHNYVLLILGVSCLYEISLTCLNYQMTIIGWSRFDAVDFGTFIGRYGQLVNLASFVLSAVVFPLLIRVVGLKYTIRIFPTMLLCANAIAFWILRGNLTVLFVSMAMLKAMTYSIHDPAKELLYIPTSNAIKFKAKFWIDIVGARLAKAVGSSINHFAGGNIHQSIRYASLPSLITALALWYACAKVGREFDDLVQEGKCVGVHDAYRRNEVLYSDDDQDDDEGAAGQDLGAPSSETPHAMELTAI